MRPLSPERDAAENTNKCGTAKDKNTKDSGFGGSGYVRIGVQNIKPSILSLNVICVFAYKTVSHGAQAGLEPTG